MSQRKTMVHCGNCQIVCAGTGSGQENGNINVKSLNRALGHHVRLVRPVCAMAFSPPASGILQEG